MNGKYRSANQDPDVGQLQLTCEVSPGGGVAVGWMLLVHKEMASTVASVMFSVSAR